MFDLSIQVKVCRFVVGVKATIKLCGSASKPILLPTGNAVDEFYLSNPACMLMSLP